MKLNKQIADLKIKYDHLNDQFSGGETEFDDFSVQPKTGTALIFKHEIKHKGCKVISGTKYALRTDIMFKK